MNPDTTFAHVIIELRTTGLSVPQIAQTLGIDPKTIHARLKNAGVVLKGPRGRAAEKFEYRGKFYSVNELAELAGVHPTTMRKRLRYWGSAFLAVEGKMPRPAPRVNPIER